MIYVKRAFIPNLGDTMNVDLVRYLVGVDNFTTIRQHQQSPTGTEHIMIGSILQWASSHSMVWGSGFISQNSRVRSQPKQICAVRGPLTRKILIEEQKMACPEVYGDPALLYPRFFKPGVPKEFELGIIPHYIDQKVPLVNKFRNLDNVLMINVRGPVEDTITQICRCRKIAASCLHGIITADAYGIPSTWIKFSDSVIGQGFKFRDYFMSVGRSDREPLVMDDSVSVATILNRFSPYSLDIDLEKLYNACPIKKG